MPLVPGERTQNRAMGPICTGQAPEGSSPLGGAPRTPRPMRLGSVGFGLTALPYWARLELLSGGRPDPSRVCERICSPRAKGHVLSARRSQGEIIQQPAIRRGRVAGRDPNAGNDLHESCCAQLPLRVGVVRTGRALILATRPFAVEVRWKSRWCALSTLALLILVTAGTFWNVHPAAKLLSSLCSGLVLVRMFVIYHDHQHHSILHKSMPAHLLFTLFGLFILAPSSIWKRSHDYHHNHNSKLFSASIGSYPIYTRQKFLQASKAERLSYLAVRHPLTIACAYVTMFMYGMCIQSFRSSPRRHYDSVIALVLHAALAGSVAVFLGWQTLLLSILLPFWIACAIGAYLFYAQHNFPGVTFKGNIEWSYEHAALDSSSYMVLPPFWGWVTANIGYHHIHHINSRIPFYRLPEAMAKIPELQQAKTTTLNPLDICRCLRLKLWDPDANRMIPLSQL